MYLLSQNVAQTVCPTKDCKLILRPLYFRPEDSHTYRAAQGYGWCVEHGPQRR